MKFQDVIREERYYCNHLFRLLCHELESFGQESGLQEILKALCFEFPEDSGEGLMPEVYTEVAVFRDIFAAELDKNNFLENLYDDFLPMMVSQYKDRIIDPIRPAEVKSNIGVIHPDKYGQKVEDFGTEDDKLFYREYSALFKAKPDFLVVWNGKALWFEAKFWEAFNRSQIQRTKNIASLCSFDTVASFFSRATPYVILLGSSKRHRKAKNLDGTRFLAWEECYKIAKDILPYGEDNYTTKAFERMVAM